MGGVMLLTLGAELASAQSQGATGGIYTCVDRNGRRLTADRPIPECLDREQRELSPSGITRRQIGPSLTELERAAQDAQNRKDAEERARVVEERRRERVLVARYPDKAAHDVERAAAIQMVDDVTATAEKRMLELKAERKKLDVEMEFYKKDPNKAPMTLRRKIAEIDDSLAEQQRFIAGQDQEKRRVHARMDSIKAKGPKGPFAFAAASTALRSARQFGAQQFVDLRRIGLALAGLHDLADQRVEGLVLARAELRHVVGVGGNHFVDDLLQRAGVVHLLESLGFDDGIHVVRLSGPQRVKHLLGGVVGDRAVGNAADQCGQLSCRDSGLLDTRLRHG